tara:strand:+ start:579 stop:1304 length:726 start_codon:yes stop_codon:yes gene_type:complete
MAYSSDTDSLDLTVAPTTPGKNLDLSSYHIPLKRKTPEEKMDADDSGPTPGQRDTTQKKIFLSSEFAKKMVWGELGKIKSVRFTASKVHFLGIDINRAKAEGKILPMFSIQKSLPQLPGGALSWAFQSEWENIVADCSKKLMDATANYLLAEKMKDLDKTATDMAQKASSDFKKALPYDDREKGLELFNIVNQSMKTVKKQKKGKKRRVNQVNTKPTLKTEKQKGKGKKHSNVAVNRRLKL